MLESVKISRRQSEIRQALATLAGKEKPDENELAMDSLDSEYRQNETRYRAALIAEDTERREAKGELETRSEKEFSDLIDKFELRQVALALDEGAALSGATAEVVQELRSKGGYRGVPVPYAALALERRAGETVASGTPDPKFTRPIIDRIFASAAASRMGAQIITIDSGVHEWPVTTSAVTAAWQATEAGAVGGPTAFVTTDRPITPNYTLGVTAKVTRRALKQSGAALEQALRRDAQNAVNVALDQAVFLGTGSDGQPLGVIPGYATYGITSTNFGASAAWSAFRSAITRFMTANAADGPGEVRLLIRPEVFDTMDGDLIDGTAVSEWDRLTKNIPNPVISSNALAAPDGSPHATNALLTVSKAGVAPIFLGLYGGIDAIRDPYSDAASGGLRVTFLCTADLTVARPAQLEVLTGVAVDE